MGRYDNEDNYVGNASLNRQRDIVLSVNEFVFIQSKTNGAIKIAAKNIGPYAIASNESISDTINKLMRGTPIEGILDKALADKING